MKAILLVLPLLFSAAAVANDTSYPSIKFESSSIAKVQGVESSTGVNLSGGEANTLFDVLDKINTAGAPVEFNAARRGLVLIAKNDNGQPVYVSLNCTKGKWDFDQNKFVPFDQTQCSVHIVGSNYESDLHQYKAPICEKKTR